MEKSRLGAFIFAIIFIAAVLALLTAHDPLP
jgi:hypothetical protein